MICMRHRSVGVILKNFLKIFKKYIQKIKKKKQLNEGLIQIQ